MEHARPRVQSRLAVIVIFFGCGLLHDVPADARELPRPAIATRDVYGEVGLLDTPTGHMEADGRFGLNVGDIDGTQRYGLWFQALPWLDVSFRYSGISNLPGYRTYYDRSFSAKFRLLSEEADFADVSFGIRDALGSGIYGAEYLVGSKHFGPLDISVGMGWGRLADDQILANPFGALAKSFKVRHGISDTGLVDFGQFLHGPKVGVFGGLAWQTPVEGLQLLAEYSGDHYKLEGQLPNGFHVRAPINIGLTYRIVESFAASAGWFYGSTFGINLNLAADPKIEYPSAIRIGPKVPPPAIRTDNQQQSALTALAEQNKQLTSAISRGPWVPLPTNTEQVKQDLLQAFYSEARGVRDLDFASKTVVIDASFQTRPAEQCKQYARIAAAVNPDITTLAVSDLLNSSGAVTVCSVIARTEKIESAGTIAVANETKTRDKINVDATEQGLQLDALYFGVSEVWVYFENYKYRNAAQASGRLIRVLMDDLPPSIEIFHLIPSQLGIPLRQITVSRSTIERTIVNGSLSVADRNEIGLSAALPDTHLVDRSDISQFPQFAWSVDPKLTQHLFDPDAPLQFMVYADVAGLLQVAPGLALGVELTGTIWSDYTFTRGAGSDLPHVRTELLQYLKRGKYGISNLQLLYRVPVARDIYAEAKAGYLEDMFMGAGGQILWRPENSRLAFGADVYQVWQRDFNRLFGAKPYNIVTGHVSAYYESPWYNLDYEIHAGRYLAGDYGATLQITRRFSSGVELGAWATFTNVPFSKFGEGSFDKGIILRIPLEWGLPVYSQSAYNLKLASLTRDGGQRLASDDSLYEDTRQASYGEIHEHLDELIEP